MWPDSIFAHPVGSFQSPVPVPSQDPDAGDLASICVSREWLPYIRGALKQLWLQSTWKTDDPAVRQLAQSRAAQLIDMFNDDTGDCMDCSTCPKQGNCLTANFRVDAGQLYSPNIQVSSGDRIDISLPAGQSWSWDDGVHYQCPGGSTFVAGVCSGGVTFDSSAPLPAVPAGALILGIGNAYFTILGIENYAGSFTVPGDIPAGTPIYLLMNSGPGSPHLGFMVGQLSVCKPLATGGGASGTICDNLDFTVNDGGMIPLARDPGRYQLPVEWQDYGGIYKGDGWACTHNTDFDTWEMELVRFAYDALVPEHITRIEVFWDGLIDGVNMELEGKQKRPDGSWFNENAHNISGTPSGSVLLMNGSPTEIKNYNIRCRTPQHVIEPVHFRITKVLITGTECP